MIATGVHLDIFLKNFIFSLLYKRVQANACHDKSISRKHVLAAQARFLQKCPWLIVTCTVRNSTTEGCGCSLTAFFRLYCSVFKHYCRFLQSELKCTDNRLALFVTVLDHIIKLIDSHVIVCHILKFIILEFFRSALEQVFCWS